MMEMFERNPSMLDMLKQAWYERKDCGICKKGTRHAEDDEVLPSGITIMVRKCSNRNCTFFEKIVLDTEEKVLDYEFKGEKK